MADTNVNENSPAWRRLASFRANFVAECNKIAYKLYPKLPKSRYAWENLTASQKRRVFGLEAGRCEECGELYQVEFIR